MRIGIVLPSVPAYSETFFLNKIKGLEVKGHTVIVFADSAKDQGYTISKIKVAPKLTGNFIFVSLVTIYMLIHSLIFHFKKSKQLYSLNRKDGLNFLQRIKSIVINNHIISEPLDWLHFGFGTMAVNRENVAKAIGAKMAVSFRGFDIGIYPIKNPGCYEKLWQKVDIIHVISDDIRNLLYEHGFQGQAEIVKITPAIDTSYFNCKEGQKFRSNTKFISIARLHWKKGLVYILEALSILNKEGMAFHYTIIGEGKEYERLKFAAYQFGIAEHVTFTGKMEPELVKEKLIESTLYLQYSIQEGFCNSVLEAQAVGLLCIVSDAEGLPENVLHEKSGWVVPKRNPKRLADTILMVSSMIKEEKDTIRKFAMNRVKKEFNLEKQQLEFVEFYAE